MEQRKQSNANSETQCHQKRLNAFLVTPGKTMSHSIFSASRFLDLFDWADELASIMQARNRIDLVQQINEAKQQLNANTFILSVIGKAKRGKSTLINSLLGRSDDQVAPIDKLPASSAITRFRKGPEKAIVLYQDNRKEEIPFTRIREFVTEEANPKNRKDVAYLEVTGAFENLPTQVEIVDTPGAGSVHEHHDALLHAFIPNSDAIIFVLTARMPLDQDELELLKVIKETDVKKIFFVLNKVDESESKDIDDALAHNEKLLASIGLSVGKFYRISAKNAFLGKPDSNVPELLAEIGDFCNESKGKLIRRRFLAKINGIIETEARAVEVALASSTKTTQEIDEEIINLQKQKQVSFGGGDYAEREFLRKWNEAVRCFDNSVLEAEVKVKDIICMRVAETSTLGVNKLVKELPTFFNAQLEKYLLPAGSHFETTARDLCGQLNAEYPALTMDHHGKVVVGTLDNTTTEKGVLVGGILAAGGYGLAAAGASTAATIAASNAAALATYSVVASGAGAASSAGLLAAGGIALDSIAMLVLGTPLGLSAAGVAGASATAAAVPVAPTLLSTPLWVALAGPVGWTLAGLGVMAVPFCWRLAKQKKKEKIDAEARKQIADIFAGIREKRIPVLREAGQSISAGYRNRLEYQIDQLKNALTSAKLRRPNDIELEALRGQCEALSRLVTKGAGWYSAC